MSTATLAGRLTMPKRGVDNVPCGRPEARDLQKEMKHAHLKMPGPLRSMGMTLQAFILRRKLRDAKRRLEGKD